MINKQHPNYASLNQHEIDAINYLHIAREAIFNAAEKNEYIAKELYLCWMELEATLQVIWGFPQNTNYIRTWYYPHCTCPKIDNDDNYPHGHYVTNEECPIHGNKKT